MDLPLQLDMEARGDEEEFIHPEALKILRKRGCDSLAERLKVQLTAKNGKMEYLKDIITQLEDDIRREKRRRPKPDIAKSILLDKERSRFRIRQLQDEVTLLSSQVRYLKGENERQIADDQGNEERIKYLLEELDKERDRVQRMSVQLAACRRKESEHRTREREVQTLRAEKKRQEHEHRSNAYILKINKMQRAEHMRIFRQGVEGLNQLSETFPYGRRARRKFSVRTPPSPSAASTKTSSRKPPIPKSGRAVQDTHKTHLKPESPRSKPLIPRLLDSRTASRRSQDTRPIALLLPKGGPTNKPIFKPKNRPLTYHENPKFVVLLPRQAAWETQPEQVTYAMVLQKPRELSISVLLPRRTQQDDKPGFEGSCDIEFFQPVVAATEEYEKAELDAQREIRELRKDLGMKAQSVKYLNQQLMKRDEEIRALQSVAGSPLPRPCTPDQEGDDEERDFTQHYIKQLQMDSSLKAQIIKNLNMQVQRRDEELKYLQSLESSNVLPRSLRESAADSIQEISQLKTELANKLEVIRNLNDQLDKRDDEIDHLQRQLDKADKMAWSVWDNNCYEGSGVCRTPALNTLCIQQKISELEMELRAAKVENQKLKAAADPEFLEEIEDIKIENQELEQLCERYEKMLHSYCGQLGFPFKPLRTSSN